MAASISYTQRSKPQYYNRLCRGIWEQPASRATQLSALSTIPYAT